MRKEKGREEMGEKPHGELHSISHIPAHITVFILLPGEGLSNHALNIGTQITTLVAEKSSGY